jgi:hypothetical protein
MQAGPETRKQKEDKMDWSVWSLKHAELRHRDVIVILLAWNQFSNKVSEEIRKHSKEFGHVMGYKGVLVLPYDDRMRNALQEVLNKNWTNDIKERLKNEQYPLFLIINRDFDDFDPEKDKFAFVWFSDMKGNEENMWEVLDAIAQKVERREDIFQYLTAVAEEAERGKFVDLLAGLSKYAEVKIPVIPGVISLNAGAIWAALVSGGGKSVRV